MFDHKPWRISCERPPLFTPLVSFMRHLLYIAGRSRLSLLDAGESTEISMYNDRNPWIFRKMPNGHSASIS